jgi:hypothetical protein
MPSQKKCSPRPSALTSPSTSRSAAGPPANAFGDAFLEKLRLVVRLLEERSVTAAPTTSAEALLSGPLTVEEVRTEKTGAPVPPAWAVVRRSEPISQGGRAAALYRYRAEALMAAAVLPAVARPCPYHLSDKAKRLGYPVHVHRRHVGHLSPLGEGGAAAQRRSVLLSHLHLARYLVANPEALALLLEAAGPEALPVLGCALARRVEALLP